MAVGCGRVLEVLDAAHLIVEIVADSADLAASLVGLNDGGRRRDDFIPLHRVIMIAPRVLRHHLLTFDALLAQISLILNLDLFHDLLMVLPHRPLMRSKPRALASTRAILRAHLHIVPANQRSIGRLDRLITLPLVIEEVLAALHNFRLQRLYLRYRPRELVVQLGALVVGR